MTHTIESTETPSELANAADYVPRFSKSVVTGCVVYVVSSLPVFLGVCLGYFALRPGRNIPYGEHSLLLRFAAWDGGQFMTILDRGYAYNPDQISNVALFPGYPALAALLQRWSGFSSAAALLAVAQVSLCAAFVVWHRYLSVRFPKDANMAFRGLVVMALFPTTFFFRMAYSESLFVLLAATILLGLHQRWPILAVALLIGAAVSVRLVGIALIPALVISVVTDQASISRKITRLAFSLPLCVWGLVAYMVFLWFQLGDPFAYSKAQASFFLRSPVPGIDHWYRLAILEPVWGNYFSGSDAYWRRHDPQLPALLSLQFANPIWFSIAVVSVLAGWVRTQMTDVEFLFGISLLALAYIGRAEEFCMGAQARYAAPALPVYIVVAQWLSRMPQAAWLTTTVASTTLLTVYSALFASWYFFL